MDLKRGLNYHQHDERDLYLGNYLDHSQLAAPPDNFTSADTVADGEWGMLLNDRIGDCAPAGALHSQKVMGRVGGHNPEFNDACAERAYQDMGSYVPGDPSTDRGCDMRQVAKVWQKLGVPDVNGHRHRCGLYVWLEPGNTTELWFALNEFKAGQVGYRLPQSAEDAFRAAEEAGQRPVWDYDASSPILGGHAVPAFGHLEGLADSVSWGARVGVTTAFYENLMDSGFVVVSSSILSGEQQVVALDHEKLVADARQLGVEFAA